MCTVFLLRKIRIFVIIAAIGLSGTIGQAYAWEEGDELVFGLVPALSPERFASRLQPLVSYLSEHLGIPVRMVGAPRYSTFIERILEGGHYDLIVSGADIYRLANRRAGYSAVVRIDGPGVFAYIATRADSEIESVETLPAKIRISTADPLSFSRRIGLRKLRELDVDIGSDVDLVVTPTQNASMFAVLSGLSDVAIFMAPVLARAEPDVRARLRILAKSDRFPHHPISVAREVPIEIADRIAEILTGAADDPDGRAALRSIGWPGFVSTEPGYYDGMDWAADQIAEQLDLPAKQ